MKSERFKRTKSVMATKRHHACRRRARDFGLVSHLVVGTRSASPQHIGLST